MDNANSLVLDLWWGSEGWVFEGGTRKTTDPGVDMNGK